MTLGERTPVLNLETLNILLTDPALRAQVSRLIANKIKSDVQIMKASAELTRHLIEQSRKGASSDVDRAALRELIKEHLDYYETLVNLSLTFSDRLVERLRGMRGERPPASTPATMELAVPLNATARAPFRLENTRASPVSVTFELTPFVSEDGSELVASTGAFDPPAAQVQPGQDVRVELILPVTGTFKPGHTYFATIAVKGLEAMKIVVRLSVEAPRSAVVEPRNRAQQPANDACVEIERAHAEPATGESQTSASVADSTVVDRPKRRRRREAGGGAKHKPRGAGMKTATRPRTGNKQTS
jgi:hypothetical protein